MPKDTQKADRHSVNKREKHNTKIERKDKNGMHLVRPKIHDFGTEILDFAPELPNFFTNSLHFLAEIQPRMPASMHFLQHPVLECFVHWFLVSRIFLHHVFVAIRCQMLEFLKKRPYSAKFIVFLSVSARRSRPSGHCLHTFRGSWKYLKALGLPMRPEVFSRVELKFFKF